MKNVNDSLGKVCKECGEGLRGRNMYLNSEELKGNYFADFVYRAVGFRTEPPR